MYNSRARIETFGVSAVIQLNLPWIWFVLLDLFYSDSSVIVYLSGCILLIKIDIVVHKSD